MNALTASQNAHNNPSSILSDCHRSESFRSRMKIIVLAFLFLVFGSSASSQVSDTTQQNNNLQRTLTSNSHLYKRVLFDEAHYNPSGFQPLVDLISYLGFEVEKTKKHLNPKILSKYNLLIIAGAMPTDLKNSVTISPDSRIIAAGGEGRTIKLWDFKTGKKLKVLQNTAWTGPLSFSRDGRLLAASRSDRLISIWDVAKGRVLKILNKPVGLSRTLKFSPDSKILAVGRDNGDIEIWDVESGELCDVLKGHRGLIYSIAFSSDGQILASGGTDKDIRLWHLTKGNTQTILHRHSGVVRSITFSPEGKTLAVAGDRTDIELWDVETKQVQKLLESNSGTIFSLAFSPDGTRLATGDTDCRIIIWNMEAGQSEHILEGHEDWIKSIAFSPAGDHIISIDDDEEIKLWDISEGNVRLELKGRSDFLWDPGPAFSEKECDAIRDWVNSGGGLLLLTDHAPWGAAAKNLAGRFSVSLSNSNGTVDPIHHDPHGNYGWLVFSRQNGLLGNHPITRGRDSGERIDRVITYYGNSLKGPEGSTSLLSLSSTSIDIFQDGKRLSAKGRSQGVAAEYGDGRIVVLGEMGMFMADAFNLNRTNAKVGLNKKDYDNRQLAINIIYWLSKKID
jgi:WD40 repeat protein